MKCGKVFESNLARKRHFMLEHVRKKPPVEPMLPPIVPGPQKNLAEIAAEERDLNAPEEEEVEESPQKEPLMLGQEMETEYDTTIKDVLRKDAKKKPKKAAAPAPKPKRGILGMFKRKNVDEDDDEPAEVAPAPEQARVTYIGEFMTIGAIDNFFKHFINPSLSEAKIEKATAAALSGQKQFPVQLVMIAIFFMIGAGVAYMMISGALQNNSCYAQLQQCSGGGRVTNAIPVSNPLTQAANQISGATGAANPAVITSGG